MDFFKTGKRAVWFFGFSWIFFLSKTAWGSPAEESWKGLYADCLAEHTFMDRKQGLDARFVDYAELADDERWPRIVEGLANYPQSALVTPEQKLAFYLNAYNILAIDMVLRHWPLKSLRSLGNWMTPVWTHNAGVVAGETVTLRQLEHEVLRKLGEPRIHFGLNCASLSCPDLAQQPYRAEIIHVQLEEQTLRFLQQENKGFALADGQLMLSSLFDWFEEDFAAEGGVKAFVGQYRPDLLAHWPPVDYLPYNWNLNANFTPMQLRRMNDSY